MCKRESGSILIKIGGQILFSAMLSLTWVFPQDREDARFVELQLIQDFSAPELFRIPGVAAMGIGKDEGGYLVFHVYVREDSAYLMPKMIGGVPVVLFPSQGFVKYDGCSDPPAPCLHRNTFGWPVPGGISAGNNIGLGAGTVGFMVCDTSAFDNLVLGYITSNHVAAMDTIQCPDGGPLNGAPAGTIQLQPCCADTSPYCSGVQIGTLARVVRMDLAGSNTVDAAFVADGGSSILDGRSENIIDIGWLPRIPRGQSQLVLDETVRKSGRTTGLTQGQVQTASTLIQYAYSFCIGGGTASFPNIILVTPASFAALGDSGAPVVDYLNRPVGIVDGADITANVVAVSPISQILAPQPGGLGVQLNCTPSAPAAVSWGINRIDAFIRGRDNQVWWKTFNGTNWDSTFTALGGITFSAPAVASWGINRLDVFMLGPDKGIWWKRGNGTPSGWEDWQSLGGNFTSAPAAVSQGLGRLDVFVRGQDAAIWQKSCSAGSCTSVNNWGNWQSIGGIATTAPAAAARGLGLLDVIARGTNGLMWQISYASGSWGTWADQGGDPAGETSAPALASTFNIANRMDGFLRGSNYNVWHSVWNAGTGWGSAEQLLGVTPTSALAGSTWPNRLDTFVRGADGSLMWNTWNGTNWSGWSSIGCCMSPAPDP